jgi:Tfp pilus assembly protein PilF
MTNNQIPITKRRFLAATLFDYLVIWTLEFNSNFEFRHSNFPKGNAQNLLDRTKLLLYPVWDWIPLGCYMEVAVIEIVYRIAHVVRVCRILNQKFPVAVLAAAPLILMVGGCTDMVTFSKQSHDEGMNFYAQKDYADAAGAFRNAVRQVPNDYQDEYWLANSYALQGQWQEAIHCYETAREIMSIDGFGQQDTKMKYMVLDGLANSIAASDTRDSDINAAEAKAQSRQSADDYLLLAKIFVVRGDADSAIDAYDRAAMIDPENFYIAKEYGLYLERLGQNQKAETPLRHAYAINGTDQQVSDALRRIGIVPGPSIKDQDALAKPLIPKGPIPEVDLGRMMNNLGGSATPASSTQSPRD